MQLMATQGLNRSPVTAGSGSDVHESQHCVCMKGAQGLTYPCCLPKESSETCAVVEQAGKLAFDVCARADGEDDHCEKSLKVEEC